MPQTLNDDLMIDLSVLEAEPFDEYRAKAGDYLSSHLLIDFMKSPKLYQRKRLGLAKDKDTASLFLGRAAHVRILEGRSAFEAQYAMDWPINPSKGTPYGGTTKVVAEWKAAQDKPVLNPQQVAEIESLAFGVEMSDVAMGLLRHGRSEGVLRATYCDTLCQSRFDWLHPQRGLVDLKTTDDLDYFVPKFRNFRYANQMAFYQAILETVVGESVPVYIVAVEKKEPYRCGVWPIGRHTLAMARRENEAAIRRLHVAQEKDEFPTGYEEMRVLDFP